MVKNRKFGFVLGAVFFVLFAVCNGGVENVAADGWISGSSTGTNVSGGGGSGGGGCGKNGKLTNSDYYDLWCTGYSWVFFKYVGGEGNSRAINFRRDGYLEDLGIGEVDNVIAGECSKHGSNGGFWHLGYNMRGMMYNDTTAVLSDWRYVKGLHNTFDSVKNLYYSTGSSKVGHAVTFDYNSIPDYYKGKYKVYDDSSLNHVIYWRSDDGTYTPLYQAEMFGTRSRVLEDFKEAYRGINNREYTGTDLPNNVYAFCWWPGIDDKSNFEGRSAVQKTDNVVSWNDAEEKIRTPWTKKDEEKVDLEVECNDNVNGCDVSFRHFLKRTAGTGDTKYTITRKIEQGSITSVTVSNEGHASNWQNGARTTTGKIADNVTLSNNYINRNTSADGWVFLGKSAIKMKPGDKVCETLEFKVSSENSTKAKTTVCATVREGEAEEKNASILMEVKNDNVEQFKNYQNSQFVYAKPDDTVTFRVTYDAAPQIAYSDCVANEGSCQYEIVDVDNCDNNCRNGLIGKEKWKNAFAIEATGFSARPREVNVFGLGNSEVPPKEDARMIKENYVGKALTEVAKINPLDATFAPTMVDEVWSTPTSYTKNGDDIKIKIEQLSSESRVLVPFNFEHTAKIDGSDSGDMILYAGEPSKVRYSIGAKSRWNATLGAEYLTKRAGNGKRKVEICYGDNCVYSDSTDILFTGDQGLAAWEKLDGLESSVLVPDYPAGTKVTVRAAVYPKDSIDDTVWDLSGGGWEEYCSSEDLGCWAFSEPVTFTIAKKPSFQVWGGDIYVGNGVAEEDIPIANKKDLAEHDLGGSVQTFGSWGELGVMVGASNGINNLASGAGFGYVANNGGILSPNPFGINIVSDESGGYNSTNPNGYCTLTFPEGVCSNNVKSNNGVASVGSLIEQIKVGQSLNNAEILSEKNDDRLYGRLIAVKEVGGESDIMVYRNEGSSYALYESDDYITIRDDIAYGGSDVKYGSLESVPKNIIHGWQIKIACNVTRVDAILIADYFIDTCGEGAESNVVSKQNRGKIRYSDKQLQVNGALIAGDTIYFNRAYGAGPGANSMVPAEIINYDSTWYAWNEGTTTTTPAADGSTTIVTSNLMVPVYTRELAPRY